MGKKMDEFVASQKEMYEKSKFKVSTYQNEIDMREEEINRLKRQLGQREDEVGVLNAKQDQMAERMRDIEEELELKSGENNRLRAQVADMEKAVADLYVSRKGEGSFEVEMEKLKADNERLILLLRASNDYQDMTEADILKTAHSGKRGKSDP
jgi:chromosome segregation ATPase